MYSPTKNPYAITVRTARKHAVSTVAARISRGESPERRTDRGAEVLVEVELELVCVHTEQRADSGDGAGRTQHQERLRSSTHSALFGQPEEVAWKEQGCRSHTRRNEIKGHR
jgi:hypothetical protein